MGIFETAAIGAGLAMDAVAVSMSNGMAFRGLTRKDYIAMPFFFGIFQGVMPLAGFYAGSLLAGVITRYSGIVICLILSLIGGNMIREGLRAETADTEQKRLTPGVLLLQAVATSIDAFAVGVGFCAMGVEILPAVGDYGDHRHSGGLCSFDRTEVRGRSGKQSGTDRWPGAGHHRAESAVSLGSLRI